MIRLLCAATALAVATVAADANTLTLDLIRDQRSLRVSAFETPGDGKGYALALRSGRIDIYDPATGTFDAVPYLTGIPDVQNVFDIAFAPDYADSGHVYVSYSTEGRLFRVVRYGEGPGGRLDPAMSMPILTIDYSEKAEGGVHYGGALDFQADGTLLVTTGDGSLPFDGVLNVA
jgi:glucose/arabinose dehydrogenase